MKFFTDPSGFTHRGCIEGIPCYLGNLEGEGPVIAGTNVVTDWMVLHLAGPLSALRTFIADLCGMDCEPCFMIEVGEPLE